MEFDLVIYHGGCPDGLAGAWPFWRANKTAKFVGMKHGQQRPNVTGLRVVIVDFSFPREEMVDVIRDAKSVLWLDHHESAKQLTLIEADNFKCVFDTSRSGAQIAWDYLMITLPEEKRPKFVEYIADRDLWKWALPESKEIGKAMYERGWYTWEKMDVMLSMTPDEETKFYTEMAMLGRLITEREEKDKAIALSGVVMTTYTAPGGTVYRVALAYCSPNLKSEIGNELAERQDCDFAALWRYDYSLDEWWISLRSSKKSNVNLPKLFEHMKCGGHMGACGFTIYGSKNENLHTYFKKTVHEKLLAD